MSANAALKHLLSLPAGSYLGRYRGYPYLVTKEVSPNGRIMKLFARQTSGRDFVSANFYLTRAGWQWRPCEMPREKVVEFLLGLKVTEPTTSD